MKNQSFQTSTQLENNRKLDTALRRFTEDRLTKEQRQVIGAALNRRSQYSLRVYQSAKEFYHVLTELDEGSAVQMLFGRLEPNMKVSAAALVCHPKAKGKANAVCIYFPTEMEEKQDGP